jgi:hypothetical protein
MFESDGIKGGGEAILLVNSGAGEFVGPLSFATFVLALRLLGEDDDEESSELRLVDRSCTAVADMGDFRSSCGTSFDGENSGMGLADTEGESGCGLMICDAPFRYVK